MPKEQIGESSITANGQITVPRNVIKLLNVEEGDRIIFLKEEGRVYIEAGGSVKVKVKERSLTSE